MKYKVTIEMYFDDYNGSDPIGDIKDRHLNDKLQMLQNQYIPMPWGDTPINTYCKVEEVVGN